jgi:ribosomal protein S14
MSLFSKMFLDDPTEKAHDECVVCGRYSGVVVYVDKNSVLFCRECWDSICDTAVKSQGYDTKDNFIANRNGNYLEGITENGEYAE